MRKHKIIEILVEYDDTQEGCDIYDLAKSAFDFTREKTKNDNIIIKGFSYRGLTYDNDTR